MIPIGLHSKAGMIFFAFLWFSIAIFIFNVIDWPLMIIIQIILAIGMVKIILHFNKYDITFEEFVDAELPKKVNKVEIIDEFKCPHCENKLEPDWKICHHCKKVLPDQ